MQSVQNPARSLPLAAASLLMLGGCAQLMPDRQHQIESSEQVSGIDRHSSFPAMRRKDFEQINLVELVDPEGRAKLAYRDAWGDKDSGDRTWGVRYDLVLGWFRANAEATPTQKQLHRNSVQDKILSVSTSRCNVFKTFLRRQQSDVNFLLGSATTAAGVLGAVLPGVTASRNLAGAAGLFSGVQAEYNNSYYSNLAAHVIVQGIELRQARLQKELVQSRQSLGIDAYSMEAAINDAIVMDGTCSTVVGLREAADSIQESNNPGLAKAAEIIAGVRAMNEIANADKVSDLAESGKLAKLLKQTAVVSSPLVVAAVKPEVAAAASLQTGLADASDSAQQIKAVVDGARLKAAGRFAQAQASLDKPDRAAADVAGKAMAKLGAEIDKVAATLPVKACVAALTAPALALGSAEAANRLKPTDEAARIQAEQALQTARANAKAAVARVQWLVRWLSDAADAAITGWTPLFSQPKLKEADLTPPVVAPVPAELAGLCSGTA